MSRVSAPKPPDAPRAGQRAVGYVEFTRATHFPVFGWVQRLRAGEPIPDAYGQPTKFQPPRMYRDADTGELVIGDRRFSIHGPAIWTYELTAAAAGK